MGSGIGPGNPCISTSAADQPGQRQQAWDAAFPRKPHLPVQSSSQARISKPYHRSQEHLAEVTVALICLVCRAAPRAGFAFAGCSAFWLLLFLADGRGCAAEEVNPYHKRRAVGYVSLCWQCLVALQPHTSSTLPGPFKRQALAACQAPCTARMPLLPTALSSKLAVHLINEDLRRGVVRRPRSWSLPTLRACSQCMAAFHCPGTLQMAGLLMGSSPHWRANPSHWTSCLARMAV